MPSHPFRPFRKNPPAPDFPASFLAEMDENRLPDIPFMNVHVEYLQPYIKASGLTPEELCERMQRPGGKTRITPELLEKTLTDYGPEMWMICRIFKALDVSWDGFRKFEEEYNERISNSIKRRSNAIYHLNHYRHYGPCLHVLQTVELRMVADGLTDTNRLFRQIKLSKKLEFHPPTAEEIAAVIATQPDACSHPYAKKYHDIGGYLYHRLPNEFYLYDLQGNMVLSGGIDLEIPNDLMFKQRRAPHVLRKKKSTPLIHDHSISTRD